MERALQLRELLDAGATTRELAASFGVSPTTIRKWLRDLGLRTLRAEQRRAAGVTRAADADEAELECPLHGSTLHRRRPRGSYACLKCRAESVVRRRRKVKAILVEEAGGRCRVCGYSGHPAALQFHHLVPEGKRFSLSQSGVARSLERAREEARKCVLLCANCHAEVEAGARELS